MARMLPPVPPVDIPDSERRFFVKLAGEPGTEDWIAFHSLGLSSSYTGHFGEIDFVIIIPGTGVVCVEVKGGGVSQRNGLWTSKDRFGVVHELKRSPFAQAKSAMFKLRKAVEERFGKSSNEARVPFGYLVVLPDVDCPPPCPEFGHLDVIDRNDLDKSVAKLICDCPTLTASRNDRAKGLGAAPFNNLRTFFRPDFERALAAGASLKPIEEELKSLTDEQYEALDTVDLNSRCIVIGPAGSGKTTLAIEYARRLSAENKSVLLACFNRMLGDWLAERTRVMGPGKVVAGSLHKLLEERIKASQLAQEFARHRSHPDLFTELYPLYGAMALDEASERFDAVLIDEAQDFKAETLAALTDAWTRDVPSARIVLFGDYTKQAIYGTPKDSLEVARSCLTGSVAVPLLKNCRNTRRIAVQTSLLSSFQGLKLYPNQPEGEAVETLFYKERSEQPQRLSEIFKQLKQESIQPDDVVVLGKYRLENSAVSSLPQDAPWTLAEASLSDLGKKQVAYSSIHAFKGLESAVVVLVDVDSLEEGEGEALLYVAMSRGRARLYMLVESRCRPDFDRKISAGLLQAVGA